MHSRTSMLDEMAIAIRLNAAEQDAHDHAASAVTGSMLQVGDLDGRDGACGDGPAAGSADAPA